MASPFSQVAAAPRDPIFGLNEQFVADPRTDKVNLCVGIYLDGDGHLPLLQCVQAAEQRLVATPRPHGYLPMDGLPAYGTEVQKLVFGAASDVVQAGRVATVQGLGGTGALKVGADFLKKLTPSAQVLVSNPTWANHRGIFSQAGFQVGVYRYYDAATRSLDFNGLCADLRAAAAGTVVILHACCHNPTGYDLKADQWKQIVGIVKEHQLMPLLDMAYQGFGNGLAEDGAMIGQFVTAGLNFLVANSFSKNFSLYGERVGALSVVCADQDEAARVRSQLKILVRTNYSNPPTHGAAIVAMTLADAALRTQWEGELAQMRTRIKSMRRALARGLKAAGVTQDTSYITDQIGMFSYSGLTQDQMQRLRQEHGIYGLDSGRLCVAALNEHNIDRVCKGVAAVV